MELYQAKQRAMDVQMRANYYRARLISLEDVAKKGIERVSDQHRDKQEGTHVLRAGLKFATKLWCELQSCGPHMLRHRAAIPFTGSYGAQANDPHAPKIHHFSKIPVDSQFDNNVSALPSKHAAAEKAQRMG